MSYKNFFLQSYDNITFDGSSIQGFTELGESDLRLGIDWSSFRLTPADIFGAGNLICKECGHQEEIVKFLHGFDNGYSETGTQCQECGRHVSVLEDENTEPNFICQCGGILRRSELLFCSQCRSKKLTYEFRMST